MKHAPEDLLVPTARIALVIRALEKADVMALTFRCEKSDGTMMKINNKFAVGRSGGLRLAIDLLKDMLKAVADG